MELSRYSSAKAETRGRTVLARSNDYELSVIGCLEQKQNYSHPAVKDAVFKKIYSRQIVPNAHLHLRLPITVIYFYTEEKHARLNKAYTYFF